MYDENGWNCAAETCGGTSYDPCRTANKTQGRFHDGQPIEEIIAEVEKQTLESSTKDDRAIDGSSLEGLRIETRLDLPAFQRRCYDWAQRKGWYPDPDRSLGDEMALITSELSEALEAYRMTKSVTEEWYSYELIYQHVPLKNLSLNDVINLTGKEPSELGLVGKLEGVPSEMADAFIRIVNFCEDKGIDLAAALEEKMTYNETRAFRHGGKHL